MRTHCWSIVQNFVPLLVEFHEVSVGPVLDFVKCLDAHWSSAIQCVSYFSWWIWFLNLLGVHSVSPSWLRMKILNSIRPHIDFLMLNLLLATSWLWSHWFLPFEHTCQANFESIYSVHILLAPKRHCCKRRCQKHCWCWALLHWALLHLPLVHVASHFVMEDDQVDQVLFTFGKSV